MTRALVALLACRTARLHAAVALLSCALLCLTLSSRPALAEPPAPSPAPAEPSAPSTAASEQPAPSLGLQSVEQRSTRSSAYSLPKGMWAFDASALGVSSGEFYGRLGVARGFGRGFQLDLNLLHWSVGLFGFDARWNFLDTRYFGLGANLGLIYGHGAWIWILGDLTQEIVSDSDLVGIPVGLTASSPVTRWLQFDLLAQYQYAQYFGHLGNGGSFYGDSQIGARQVMLRPGVRFFLSDASALEFAARLPVYTRVPVEADTSLDVGRNTRTNSRSGYVEADFQDNWNLELGLRSRLRPWLFATMRLHYGRVAKTLYGAPLYPSFGLEFRL